ncbi:nickel pincer cofactor biosynthesis protein LarC [Geodermatophilus sp. DSM 44513]|uniref:nickel pincer cofactor biosynthesis protein LarC n=1 Tax=Geodermatophilus sp. DSM 44513 TaxID=1528104 RepID=UPI00127D8134|nr:nickel pincer cofactor biosynthesis protein LarC [Geodermatophilus sp. DSM 44513]WNV76921.1 nickel pincer cofactor biosynthesis protein LarC [Geodermatophilus sp. DSM 44513]
MTGRVGWLDCGNGVAGDMLLGAVVGAGVPLAHLAAALEPLQLPVALRAEDVSRAGLRAVRVVVEAPEAGQPTRTWADVRGLLGRLPDPLRATATGVFGALAVAEAAVHGVPEDDVHFHEVGALDAIADVVGVCAGLAALGLDRLVVSPIALGGGHARTAHGTIPVPGPAVLALLAAAGAPGRGGPDEVELATPTGVALATTLADGFGPMPLLRPTATGTGAGTRDPAGRPNVVRLVVGEVPAGDPGTTTAVVLEANVDDLDPRAWPLVLTALLDAGALDAWLTPTLMKKGRPAHVVAALAPPSGAARVREVLLRETTTLGVRETSVVRHAVRRTFGTVDVDGQPVAVKLGWGPDGAVLNAMPEWEDVARAAAALDRPVTRVLAHALGLAEALAARTPPGGE